jgi:hypothetical protein
MSAVDIKFGGGEKMKALLESMAAAVSNARQVRAGFLEDSSYPAREPGADRFLKGLDKLNSVGPFQPGQKPHALKDYRKRKKAREQTFIGPPKPLVALHVAQVAFWNEYGTETAPARPFFRNMIRSESPAWGDALGNYLKSTEYDAQRSLGLMGVDITDSLKSSINEWPADNAPLTVKIKGFNHGLIASNLMQRSTDYEVQT